MPLTVTSLRTSVSCRSWKAQLSSLNETIKSSKLEFSCCAPWFQDVSHLESPEFGNHSASVLSWVFIPQDIMHVQGAFPQKDHATTSYSEKSWKILNLNEQEQPVELKCMSVTGFTALFTWTEKRSGCTIVLWDLETEGLRCFSLDQKCIPIDSSGDKQLCLVLTGENILHFTSSAWVFTSATLTSKWESFRRKFDVTLGNIVSYVYFLWGWGVALGFELGASYLLGRYCYCLSQPLCQPFLKIYIYLIFKIISVS
jgi:hypothetical protein